MEDPIRLTGIVRYDDQRRRAFLNANGEQRSYLLMIDKPPYGNLGPEDADGAYASLRDYFHDGAALAVQGYRVIFHDTLLFQVFRVQREALL